MTTVPPPDHTASRLTEYDLDKIEAAALDAVDTGHPNYVAQRLCAHAIGCSLHDLRDTELAVIDDFIQYANTTRSNTE